ncbi:hypothetical protein DMENIID0001_019150 [Sergentomyia squamirostris]
MDRERVPLLNGYVVEVVEFETIVADPEEEEIGQVLTLEEITYYSIHPVWKAIRNTIFVVLWILFGTLLVLSWSTAIYNFKQYCISRPFNSSDNFHK